MSAGLLGGIIALILSCLYLLDIVRRAGKRFEYAYAMFLGELGLMAIVLELTNDGDAKIAVAMIFGASMIFTAVLERKLYKEYRERTKG